jgi:hypothetical protein
MVGIVVDVNDGVVGNGDGVVECWSCRSQGLSLLLVSIWSLLPPSPTPLPLLLTTLPPPHRRQQQQPTTTTTPNTTSTTTPSIPLTTT